MAQKHLHPNPGHDLSHRDPIHSRCPRPGIARYPLPRVHQKRRVIDQVEQVTEPASSILTRPTVQFDLHPSYRPESRIDIRPLHSTGVHRCIFEHCILSLTDTLPPFPMCAGSPRLGVLRRLRPTPSVGRHRAYPPPHPQAGSRRWSGKKVVPTFTVVRSTGEAPALPLRHRHGYAVDLHRGLPDPKSMPDREFPAQPARRICTANQPTSTGLELALPEEA